jgi:signal transduction histidine kinase
MDSLGPNSDGRPGDQHTDLTGGTNTDPSVTLHERREQSTLRMEIPGFQTMRLVSPVNRSLVERPESPAHGTLLPLIRKSNYDHLRSALSSRCSMKKTPNPMLDTLSKQGREAFDRIKTEFSFKVGESLELDNADRAGLYFIDRGRVEIEHTFPERLPHQRDQRKAGEFFGEYVVLDGVRRITVHVKEDTTGVWIPANRFGSLVEIEPSFLLNLTRIVLRNQSEHDNKLITELSETKAVADLTIQRLQAVTATSEAINSAQDLDELMQVVLREARHLTHAERGTVYLVDREAGEIYSFVNDHGQRLKFSLPIGQGFAGLAVEQGVTINIEDAYQDPRFHPEVDQETGIRTRSVLTMPIRNPSGIIVGVIQLLNKKDHGVFNSQDEETISTLGVHAAIAIDRTLIGEAMNRNQQLAAVGNLAASIIHDLKSPLTVIQGYVDLLNYTMASTDQRSHLEHISSQLHRMVGMTQEVLDFARGQIRLNPAQTPVRHFLTQICESFSNELKARNIELEFECDLEDQDWSVILDKERFTRVLTNLITNAKDAMPGGGTLTVEATQFDSHWELQISDTGIGISAGRMQSIFDPFSTHGKRNGTGLGLTIAQNVISEHGGDIHVDSEEGVGTTFTLQMPLRPQMTTSSAMTAITVDTLNGFQTITDSSSSVQGDLPSMN